MMQYHGFKFLSNQKLEEIDAEMQRFEYEKNGAELVWLKRDDENKTFGIAFKTIPSDDTGVFHILEHSVLCGSKKYPVKEPFVELIKSSMATFLNAMTFPDKTFYPISSRNMQDYLNLTDVYMDAVFHPMSIYDPNAFRQEGWHYETDGGELSCNGVVYNEMKGAYASPDSVLMSEINKLLFPDNCYGFESGGHPDHITELTYENYLANHKRFYHPSNARIIIDGSFSECELETVFAKLDSFLSEYDRMEVDADIPMQTPVSPEESVQYYEIGAEESIKNKGILADAWVFGDFTDIEKSMAFSVLSEVVAGSNESPLPKALLEKGLAEDVELGKMDGIQQIFAYLIARNIDPERKGEIRSEVKDILTSLAENGLDHKLLHSTLSRMEFATREKEFDGLPRGLIYAISMLESWLYGGDPAQNLSFNELFASLRRKIDEGWFEQFLRDTMIENAHHAQVCLLPSKTLGEEKNKAEQERLAEIRKNLTDDEIAEIKAQFEALRAAQEKPDSPEELALLPKLSLKDIPTEGSSVPQNVSEIGGVKLLHQPLDTNGITYLNMYFSLDGLTDDELSMAGFLATLIGQSATQQHSVIELQSLLYDNFGRFTAHAEVLFKRGSVTKAVPCLVTKVALLERNKPTSAEIIDEVINRSDFSDKSFIYNILRQTKTGMEQDIAMKGNAYAAKRAMACCNEFCSVRETMNGIEMLRWFQNNEKNFESCGDGFCKALGELAEKIFTKKRLVMGFTGELDKSWLEGILAVLKDGEEIVPVEHKKYEKVREGFTIPAEISFAVKGGDIHDVSTSFTGVSRVAAQLTTYDYLWNEVRVKGGAYGTGMRVESSGLIAFTSYRDPNPANSISCYNNVGCAIREFCDNGGDLEKYIISTVAATEPLLTPRSEGEQAEGLYLSGRSYYSLQKLRVEILRTTKADLYEFADTVDELLDRANVCIVGGSGALNTCGELLDKTEAVSVGE